MPSWDDLVDPLDDMGLSSMSRDQLELVQPNDNHHHHLASEVPQIHIAIPSNAYSPMGPPSSHLTSPTPSYMGPSSSTTDESRRFFSSPHTPYLSPGQTRFSNIASGTDSLASSPTIHSPFEITAKPEVSRLLHDALPIFSCCVRSYPQADRQSSLCILSQ